MAAVAQWTRQRYQVNDFKSKVKPSTKDENGSCIRNSFQNPRHHEVVRLLSFAKFPREIPCSLILLARNGFMYTGKGTADDDTVTCAFCSSVGSNLLDLTSNDKIEVFHRKLNPNCRVVMGLDSGNKLIDGCGKESFADVYKKLYERRNKDNNDIVPTAEDYKLPRDDSNNTPAADSLNEVQSPPVPNEELQSSDTGRSPSTENCSNSNFLQQAVEDRASSQIITNRTQSLPYSGQNIVFESGDNLNPLVNNINSSSSSPVGEFRREDTTRPDGSSFSAPPSNAPSHVSSYTAASSYTNDNQGNTVRPDGSSFSTPCSNAPSQVSSNTTASFHTNDNQGNLSNQSATSRTHGHTSTTSDSTTARESGNVHSASQPSASNLQSSAQGTSSSQRDGNDVQNGVSTYDKLGICTARPKRPEYAVEQVRLQSFEGWPGDHHIKPAMLAKAGYFYTGYSDCARCFFCGGGLRNWEEGDDVWVEHARWFKKCTFVRQSMGQTFIDTVQDLNKEKEIIPYRDVIKEMEARGLEIVIPRDIEDKSPELKKDIAVKTVLDNGFSMEDTLPAAEKVKEMGYSLTSDLIFEELVKMGARKSPQHVQDGMESGSLSTKEKPTLSQETMDSLIKENNNLRQQSLCKICLDNEVAVVFLPCGHFVSCRDCSYALKACPMCRESIKGVVRGYLS